MRPTAKHISDFITTRTNKLNRTDDENNPVLADRSRVLWLPRGPLCERVEVFPGVLPTAFGDFALNREISGWVLGIGDRFCNGDGVDSRRIPASYVFSYPFRRVVSSWIRTRCRRLGILEDRPVDALFDVITAKCVFKGWVHLKTLCWTDPFLRG